VLKQTESPDQDNCKEALPPVGKASFVG